MVMNTSPSWVAVTKTTAAAASTATREGVRSRVLNRRRPKNA